MLALPLLSMLLFAGGQNDPQSAGLQALDRKDYQQAEQIFSKLVDADAKNYSALFNLALAETALRQDAQAIDHYRQALALQPGLYPAEVNLGILYLRGNQASDALPLLRDAVKQKPTEARPQRYLGDALLAAGDLNGAEEAYRQAVTMDPKLASAELGLGESLERQGKLDDALPHYRKAAELDPNFKPALLNLSQAYSKANKPDQAIAILKDFPDNIAAREELGRLYLASNQWAQAVTEFQAAVSLDPSSANQLALATAYLKNNQPDLATPILEKALAADPKDYDLHMAIGRIRRDKRDFTAASDQFLAAAQIRPTSAEAWSEAAAAFILAEQYPQALAALDKIHELKAEKPGDFYFRGVIYDKLHQLKPAIASYQQFLQTSGGQFPDQEFIARQRSRILQQEANR